MARSLPCFIEVANPHIACGRRQELFDGIAEVAGTDEIALADPYLRVGWGVRSASGGSQRDLAAAGLTAVCSPEGTAN
ncbi:hypothetical protein KRM28CT15_04770 [Krasilnikovia sp. M28-CT-15]